MIVLISENFKIAKGAEVPYIIKNRVIIKSRNPIPGHVYGKGEKV